MVEFGHDVSFEQARSQIGKGGDKLIPVFLAADEQRDHGNEIEQWRGKTTRNVLRAQETAARVPLLLDLRYVD
jgi:hypothetical protein